MHWLDNESTSSTTKDTKSKFNELKKNNFISLAVFSFLTLFLSAIIGFSKHFSFCFWDCVLASLGASQKNLIKVRLNTESGL